MAFFDRFKQHKNGTAPSLPGVIDDSKKNTAKLKGDKSASSASSNASVAKEKTNDSTASLGSDGRFPGVLIKPHVSEKAAVLAERGIYVFDVSLHANKVEIRKAVESLYHVNVIAVRTQRGIGKIVRRGRSWGQQSSWKKALVQLKKGQSIHLVEGV